MIKVKVPELMKKEGWNVSDLMRKADGHTQQRKDWQRAGDSICFEVLSSLGKIFDVDARDILENMPDK